MKMPLRYVCEMVCDRAAAARLSGLRIPTLPRGNTTSAARPNYLLHPAAPGQELLKMARDLGHDRTFEHMQYAGLRKDY